jgi:hypothetical protein
MNGSRPFKYLTSDHLALAATQMIVGSVPQCRPTSLCMRRLAVKA